MAILRLHLSLAVLSLDAAVSIETLGSSMEFINNDHLHAARINVACIYQRRKGCRQLQN